MRNLVCAEDSGFSFESIVVSRRLLKSSAGRALIRRQESAGTPVADISADQFRSISSLPRASGIAAIVVQRKVRLEDCIVSPTDCFVALSRIRASGNFGSLIRTAAAVRASGFVLIGHSTDPFAPATIRASMGSVFRQKFFRCSWQEFALWKQACSVSCTGASPSGNLVYPHVEWTQPTVLMLGEERQGLSSRQKKYCDQFVRLPMADETDSLNIAVAGGILLYNIFADRCLKSSRRP